MTAINAVTGRHGLKRPLMTMHRALIGVVAIWMSGTFAGPVCQAAGLDRPAGAIIGIVSAVNGVAQMGATVSLYNHFDRLVKTASTNEKGAFGFDGLLPDRYSLRVNLSAFMPAFRQGVEVQAGNRTFLAIQLAGALSSIELVYNGQANSGLMNDDWKWVLRSSMSTRPALRLLPGWNTGTTTETKSIFSSNRAMLKLSAGDGAAGGDITSQPDLGTAFAFATSLLGTNHLQFSGNVGYASHAGLPSAGFRTRYKRTEQEFGGITSAPEVQLTMRQVFSQGRAGLAIVGSGREAPVFRSLSTSFIDRVTFFDGVELLYGAAMESVTFLERLNYVSPYARLSVAAGKDTSIRVAYSSGLPPEEIYTAAAGRSTDANPDRDLQQDLSALNLFPRVSSRAGRIKVQRSTNLEAGIDRKIGKGQLSLVAWHEAVSNGALSAVGDTSVLPSSDVLPDMFNRSSIVNIGHYARQGYMAGYTYRVSDTITVTGGYGNNGTLLTDSIELTSPTGDALRGAMRHGRRHWAYARASAVLPVTKTRVAASYQFADYSALMPMHRTLTGNFSPEMGLNFQMRQPLPSFGMWNGRVEAIAELRNLLHQGYIPVTTSDGRSLLLMQAPKTVRGGLNFIF